MDQRREDAAVLGRVQGLRCAPSLRAPCGLTERPFSGTALFRPGCFVMSPRLRLPRPPESALDEQVLEQVSEIFPTNVRVPQAFEAGAVIIHTELGQGRKMKSRTKGYAVNLVSHMTFLRPCRTSRHRADHHQQLLDRCHRHGLTLSSIRATVFDRGGVC